jgi:Zn-dependent peptidase ImmA (M78 family)
VSLRRGFKKEANKIALEIRAELGLGPRAPLDPWKLAQLLLIPVIPLSSLARDAPEAFVRLTGIANSAFSAVTVFVGTRRGIVYNDAHTPGRQASDIAHELAHALLLHPPRASVNSGTRDWNAEEEGEAAWLSGALLISDEAAIRIAKAAQPTALAATEYGVSEQMVIFRLGVTGARVRVERSKRYSRGPAG